LGGEDAFGLYHAQATGMLAAKRPLFALFLHV